MPLTPDQSHADCAAEPIHLSGAIQPHGYLVAVHRNDWRVAYASDNIEALLTRTARSLLGEDLREELSSDIVQAVTGALLHAEDHRPGQRCCRDNVGAFAQLCDIAVFCDERHVYLEFEPVRRHWLNASASVLADSLITRVVGSEIGGAFFDSCARQVRQLTGFDRVMVYRFLHDGSGEVVAEARSDASTPYLGLRFPAFDIPEQARALYLKNRIRAIPDAGYVPVPLVSATSKPLDLTHAALRSVSPVHLEYLVNMGVASSLSVSIVCDGRLWGLVACHHSRPLQLDPPVRSALELFGRFVSLRVTSQQQEVLLEEAGSVDYLVDSVGESALRTGDLTATLLQWMGPVCALFDADAAAVIVGGRWAGTSTAIDAAELDEVARWLAFARSADLVYSDRAVDWSNRADGVYAGVLALQLVPGTWFIALRREQVQSVRWAGRPEKILSETGARLGPRRSFAEWQEAARGSSAPWTVSDIRRVRRFGRGLVDLRRRAGGDVAADAVLLRQRQDAIDDQCSRLLEVAQMLETLPPLDNALSRAVADHIDAFDRQLRNLILRGKSQLPIAARQVDLLNSV